MSALVMWRCSLVVCVASRGLTYSGPAQIGRRSPFPCRLCVTILMMVLHGCRSLCQFVGLCILCVLVIGFCYFAKAVFFVYLVEWPYQLTVVFAHTHEWHMGVQYLWYVLMEFCQMFVSSASWIFGSKCQRSRSRHDQVC